MHPCLLYSNVTKAMVAGTMSNGYQQTLANFSISSGGSLPSMGGQRMTSQMIPTPGYNNINNNNKSNNQSLVNMESSSSLGGYSTVESTMASQPQQQKQYAGGQNSHILQNLGSQMGSSIRSGLQQKSYGFSNGALNSGMGMITNNLQLVSEPCASEGYMTPTPYASSPKPLQQHFDQQQQQIVHGNTFLPLFMRSIMSNLSIGNVAVFRDVAFKYNHTFFR